MCNVAYWITNPVSPKALKVLRRIDVGHKQFNADKFEVALLIAEGMVKADLNKCTLSVTEKGHDALNFYKTT